MVKYVKVLLKKPWTPIGRNLDYAAVEITRERHTAYITLGSNMGNKEENFKNAIKKIQEVSGIKISKISTSITPFKNSSWSSFPHGSVTIKDEILEIFIR